jgi:hypothetical protein
VKPARAWNLLSRDLDAILARDPDSILQLFRDKKKNHAGLKGWLRRDCFGDKTSDGGGRANEEADFLGKLYLKIIASATKKDQEFWTSASFAWSTSKSTMMRHGFQIVQPEPRAISPQTLLLARDPDPQTLLLSRDPDSILHLFRDKKKIMRCPKDGSDETASETNRVTGKVVLTRKRTSSGNFI